jgi:hypothetical protein
MGVVVIDHEPRIWWSTANPLFSLNYPAMHRVRCAGKFPISAAVPSAGPCVLPTGSQRLTGEPRRAVTDDRERLARAIEGRSSTKVGAIDETMKGAGGEGNRRPRAGQGRRVGDQQLAESQLRRSPAFEGPS